MTGKNMLDLLDTRVGEKYVFGALVPKNDKNYHGPWDCAEFFSWGVFQVSGRLYGCANNNGNPATMDAYTGFLGRDAHALGKIISIDQAIKTPGAGLLRLSGAGIVGHVVCSNGYGGTTEAHSTKRGVIHGTVAGRRFDLGFLVPWMDYETTDVIVEDVNTKPKSIIYRFIEPNMKGREIKAIQKVLGIPEDGVFGHQTFNAVRAYQIKKGLTPDGEVGPKTLAVMGISF